MCVDRGGIIGPEGALGRPGPIDAKDVFLAVPTRGSIRNETVSVLEAIRTRNPDLGPVGFSAGHLSSHETREQIVSYFLTTNKPVLIMLDDDVVPPLDILDMVKGLDEYDIVGAAVPMFQPKVAAIPLLMAWNYVPDVGSWQTLGDVWGQTGLVACDGVGFGCVAIHRRVFEKLDPPYFPMEHGPGGTITDDLSFCRRARANGFSVACDFTQLCEHHSNVPLLKLSEGISDLIDASIMEELRFRA